MLPLGSVRGGELHRGLCQRPQQFARGHAGLCKAGKLGGQRGEGIQSGVKGGLDAAQAFFQPRDAHLGGKGAAGRAQLGPLLPVQDVAFRRLEMAALHEGALHQVLHRFHGGPLPGEPALHRGQQLRQHLAAGGAPHAGKGLLHGRRDLARVVGLVCAATLFYVHAACLHK